MAFAQDRDTQLKALGWLLHGVGAIALLAGWAGAYYVFFEPLDQQAWNCRERTDEVVRLLGRASAVRKEHAALKQSLAEIEERAKAIRESIPDEPREAEFLRQLTRSADEEGVKIHDFHMGAAASLDQLSRLTVELSLEGDYVGLCGFFDRLGRISRIATVEKLDLAASAESAVYPVQMTLMLYFGMRAENSSTRTTQNGAT